MTAVLLVVHVFIAVALIAGMPLIESAPNALP
mgnify:CR=1 FL=1